MACQLFIHKSRLLPVSIGDTFVGDNLLIAGEKGRDKVHVGHPIYHANF